MERQESQWRDLMRAQQVRDVTSGVGGAYVAGAIGIKRPVFA